MPTIADGECFASNIPQAKPSPVACGEATLDKALTAYRHEFDALTAERDPWKLRAEEALTMLREQGDKHDEAIARAEAAEAEVTRCKAEYARLRRKWLDQTDTIALYQPVVNAAVTWVKVGGSTSEDNLWSAVRTLQAALPKGLFAEAADMLDAAHHPQSEKSCATCRNMDGEMCELSGTMAEFCLENAFTYWCPAAELQKCPQCRGLTWIVGWSGENPCKDTCPKCRGTGIVVGFRAAPWTQEDVSPLYIGQDADAEADLGIDGMGPNGPVLHETDARDGIPSMKAVIAWHTSSKIEKSCGTCDNGHGGECTLLSAAEEACLNSDRLAMWEPRKQFEAVKTCASCQFDVVDVLTEEPCVSCQWPSLSNWQPKEHNRDA